MESGKCILSIKSFSRPGQKPHWAFHIQTGGTHTNFYELAGAPPNLYYNSYKAIDNLAKRTVDIGEIVIDQLDAFEEVVSGVEPRQHVSLAENTEYGDMRGCRVWCLDCIAPLKQKGWVYDTLTEWNIIDKFSD